MFRSLLASQSDMRLEVMDNGSTELKWCVFTKEIRGPIAKIIVDTRKLKLTGPQDENEPSAHIVNVFVKPDFRGKQLGEHLVRLAQQAMRDNGFHWLTLEAEENVEHHGRLVGLYERCGFSIFPAGATKFQLEYNGDECFRKVPMRCNLRELVLPGEEQRTSVCSTSTTTTTTSSSEPVAAQAPPSKFANVDFVQEMKREALAVLQARSLNVDVRMALDWVDQYVEPGSLDSAFKAAARLRALGHPDWMELGGFLRHLGRVQEKWTSWHAPFMVQVQNDEPVLRQSSAASSDEDEDDALDVKSGPLPNEVREARVVAFIDPERYSQQGVDEAVLTWTASEFAFLALTLGDASSAPREMAQLVRYCACDAWLDGDGFSYLEAWGDADVKQLAVQFRDALREADAEKEALSLVQLEEGRSRLAELVDKYVSDVRMM